MAKTVLLITNTSWKQAMARKMSQLEGFYVILVSDLEEALCLLSEIRFDLIMIDITIQRSCFELCRRMLVNCSIPVLFFDGFQVLGSGWDRGVEKKSVLG